MNKIKIYKPDDNLNFGKYKGEDLRFIYTFDPKYIEWLIINNDHFAIDINDFQNRHTFQIDISGVTSGERFGFVNVQIKGEEIRNLSLREYLNEFFPSDYKNNYIDTPLNINKFELSDKVLSILKNKIS